MEYQAFADWARALVEARANSTADTWTGFKTSFSAHCTEKNYITSFAGTDYENLLWESWSTTYGQLPDQLAFVVLVKNYACNSGIPDPLPEWSHVTTDRSVASGVPSFWNAESHAWIPVGVNTQGSGGWSVEGAYKYILETVPAAASMTEAEIYSIMARTLAAIESSHNS
ncbi:hypothetical protein [Streptomyces sp. NPDC089919]|uniref:hypothetical protein n=1 Tax=Streptomyces sp. NPDC089919 TaxID=3155188 RepID=UPI0034193291